MRKAKQKNNIKKNLIGWLICGLPVIGFILFHLIPLVVSFFLSFSDLKGYDMSQAEWVGLKNFETLFNDPLFWKALKTTLVYCLVTPMTMIAGFIVAWLLSKNIKFKKLFRAIFFIPYVCSTAAVALMWKWIFEPDFGALNAFLKLFGVERIEWLYDSKYFMSAVFIVVLWSGTGFAIILYQSAFANVDKSYYEAAMVDGASDRDILFNITIPMTSPTTFYLWTTGIINSLQVFAILQVLSSGGSSSGGPDYAAYSVVYYLFDMAFTYPLSYGLGLASACAWVLATIIFVVTRVNFKAQDKLVVYEG